MALEFKYNGSNLDAGLSKLSEKVGAAVLIYMATKAPEIEAKMKINRPWIDRTNMAKNLLNVKVSQPEKTKIRMTLAHGVTYGMWLELAHSGNYAIIRPTLDAEAPKVIQQMGDLMSKIK